MSYRAEVLLKLYPMEWKDQNLLEKDPPRILTFLFIACVNPTDIILSKLDDTTPNLRL